MVQNYQHVGLRWLLVSDFDDEWIVFAKPDQVLRSSSVDVVVSHRELNGG